MPRQHKFLPRLLLVAACLFADVLRAENLAAAFDQNGLSSLEHDGFEFVKDGKFRLVDATFRQLDGTKIAAAPVDARFDPDTHVATLESPQLHVTCACAVAPDRVTFTIDVKNTSNAVLEGICLQPLEIHFPQQPRGWRPLYPCLGHNLGWPTIDVADFGSQTIAFCNEDFGRPLIAGFPARLPFVDRPIWVSSANIGWLSPYLDPLIRRPIYPGGSDRYRLSLRFATGSLLASEMARDLCEKFAATYPRVLKWTDRRAIGALFLGRHESVSRLNPHAWFDDPAADFTGPAGVARFQKKLQLYADESVRVLKGMNAQGMILWDAEGEEFPHSTTYLGDPRSLPPEIEPVIDSFFKKFTAAGLRVGVTLRPQRPVRPLYDGDAFQIDVADVEKNLGEKIDYAQKRWGCTLFYVDSNGDPNVPVDAMIFRRLAAAHPDVLLMPEHKNALYYASTAPFHSFFHHGVASTPADVLGIYPDAFGVIYAPEGPIDERHADLLAAVRRGDILLFHGWFDDPSNVKIKRIYEEANRR